ncbi:MAG: heparan-alpha-glucosaminide N-acetyltransferase domain-containing protein [Clostridia bacterium]|nr:heparan-alpha-glucosaminide N-acetyltransferase domain-containing protein [Clostridia bacterium]
MRDTNQGQMLENNIVLKKKRIWELDFIRGILLILVTWDHIGIFGYCWGIIGTSNVFSIWLKDVMFAYLASPLRWGFEPILIWMLILLSGINCTFSRNHTSRAAQMLLLDLVFICGYEIAKVIAPQIVTGYTVFNILTIFSLSFIVWVFVDKFKIKTEYLFVVGLTFVIFGLYYYLQYRTTYLGEPLVFSRNSQWLFFTVYNQNAYVISSNNFEPLFPSLGFFLLGGVFGRSFYNRRSSLTGRSAPKFLKPTLWIGKHSLSVFLCAAPILVFFMWILTLLRIL